MQRIFPLLLQALLLACTTNTPHRTASRYTMLREGDLLFCINATGNAITDVTEGTEKLNIDHVAIAHYRGDSLYALEAVKQGVVLTKIDSFMKRNSRNASLPQVLACRLRDTTGVWCSVSRALTHLGKPYDYNFMPDDERIYCSELVQKSYVNAKGKLIFSPIPMSFHDRNGRITDYWKAYYGQQGLRVPEGKQGSNPGDLSRRKELTVVYRFYKP